MNNTQRFYLGQEMHTVRDKRVGCVVSVFSDMFKFNVLGGLFLSLTSVSYIS